jgi:hypothetical protein
MNHFHHDFHLLLSQRRVVGFVHELDYCQLLLTVAMAHCCSEVRHCRRCCISWFWSNCNLRILLYSGLDSLWSKITSGHSLDCLARWFLIFYNMKKILLY